jgi:tyrosinase
LYVGLDVSTVNDIFTVFFFFQVAMKAQAADTAQVLSAPAPSTAKPPTSPATAAPVIIDPAGKRLDPSSGFRDWTARIRFKKSDLHRSFAVHIFLAEPPADPREWIGAPGFVGSHYAFVNSAPDKCSNCTERANTIYEGYVHLNTTMAKYSSLPTFEEDVVQPYLKNHLHWRVQKVWQIFTAFPTATDNVCVRIVTIG